MTLLLLHLLTKIIINSGVVSEQLNNNNASRYANVIDGCNNDVDIADRWRVHFDAMLLYCIAVDQTRNIFFGRFSEVCNQPGPKETVINVHDLQYAYRKQKFGKAQGSDGVHMESIIYGGTRLCTFVYSV